MKITLKMSIQEHEFLLNVDLTNRAGRIYRQKYNRDILKDMAALYKKINKSFFDDVDFSKIDIVDKTEEEISKQIMANVDMSKLIAAEMDKDLFSLDFEETEQAGQIIWAFAKNADEKLPDYEDWIDDFDFVLPVDKIITEIYTAWGKSAQPIIELKN